MVSPSRLTTLMILSAAVLAACSGGGGGEVTTPVPPPPPTSPTEQDRINAATSTIESNSKCSTNTLGSYYWEIGDATGKKAGYAKGVGAPTATTSMQIFSASKWLYAANVLQKHGANLNGEEVSLLNFTSGHSMYTNAPICLPGAGSDTVQGCAPKDGTMNLDPSTVGKYAYDSGHMQYHATQFMGLGASTVTGLAADLNATVGNLGFAYHIPQLAAGVIGTADGYAQFLRKLLRNELVLSGLLGTQKVCAQQAASGCNAVATPDSIGTEAWNYSLGHWVEDDPVVGDHAFSSAGGAGFYPWIDSGKTIYGIIARQRNTGLSDIEPGAGYFSAECGRLVRQAWRTAQTVTATVPTPPTTP